MEPYEKVLKPLSDRVTLYVGIGNTLCGDDGVGPYIIRALEPLPDPIRLLDVGEHPEEAVEYAVGAVPAKTVFLDCADYGGEPGEIRPIEETALVEGVFSTHRFPVRAVARIISRDTCSEVYIIGIQPLQTLPGQSLSPPVLRSARRLINLIGGGVHA